jgi:CHAT domain
MHRDLCLLGEADPDDGFAFEERAYLRTESEARLGPSRFQWSARQLADLTALFEGDDADGARQRIGRDLARFLSGLSFIPDEAELQAADDLGEEVLFTVRSAAPELYTLPWEIIRTDEGDTFLADHPSVMVRCCVPGLPARALPAVPQHPGVLLAWSDAGGRVPSAAMKENIQAACEAGHVAFVELPRVHAGSLQDALDDTPLSVLHLLCHGLPPRKPGEPAMLAWGDGSHKPATAVALAKLLRPYRDRVRMVVLSVCGSGDGSQDALFLGSVAQEIHKQGIPTVVASRYRLSIPGAIRLVKSLYDKLLREGWSLERSVRHARTRLFRADELGETHQGDAYGLQIYTHALEACGPEGGGKDGERPVLGTYPFGTPQVPAPATAPPQQVLTIVPAATPEARKAQRDALLAALRMLTEDPAADLLGLDADESTDESTEGAV